MYRKIDVKSLVRTTFWAIVFILTFQICFGVTTQSLKLFLMYFGNHFSSELQITILFAGALFGLGLGFMVCFYLVPAAICQITNAKKTSLFKTEYKSNLFPPLYLIPGSERPANAFLAGIPLLNIKLSEPTVFFTEALIKKLNPEELKAVLLHEISHLKLNHLLKRLFYGTLGVALAFITLVILMVILLLVFKSPFILQWMILGSGLTLGLQILFFKKLLRQQEFEADAYSILHFGGEVKFLISALEKLDQKTHSTSNSQIWNTHPSLEERRKALLKISSETRSDQKAA